MSTASAPLLSPVDTGLPARAAGLTAAEFLATAPRLDEFWTPLVTLDQPALAANARTMSAWAAEHGCEWMPHGKTTMAPALWRLQLAAGATGITLATPGQVRTARAFGVGAVMLANALVAPPALRWLAEELSDDAFSFTCWADSPAAVEAMERVLLPAAPVRPVEVLVERGAPGGRAGARSHDEALVVARRVQRSPVLRLAGTAGYEGSYGAGRGADAVAAVRGYLDALLDTHRAIADLAGRDDVIVTAGGSAYLDLVAERFAVAAPHGRRIVRAGAVITHDDGFYRDVSPLDASAGAVLPLVAALRGYARVVSQPEPGLAILDGGKRDFPFDLGLPGPLGVARELGAAEVPLVAARITALNDQHAYLRSEQPLPVRVGDVVSLGLSHPCTAFDKRRILPVVEGERVVDLIRTWF